MTLTSNIEFHESENNCFLVKHRSTHKYVKMGSREAEFLKYLIARVDKEVLQSEYTGELNEDEQVYLAEKFKEWGFLDHEEHPLETEESNGKERRWRLSWKVDDITTIKFLTVNPDEWLTRSLPLISRLVHPVAISFYILLILVSGYLVINDSNALSLLSLEKISIFGYIGIYIMILLTTVIHEFAHGMVCKYYGGRVKQMGAMLFYFNPAMFCDVSDTYIFKRKRHKLSVIFAGIFSQWIMSSTAVVIYYALTMAGIHAPLLFYYAIANLGLSVINMLPLVKLDGYWMLSHGLGIVNLRTKAFRAFFQLILPWRNRSSARENLNSVNRWERFILLFYGFAATMFTPFFWSWGLYSVQKQLYSLIGTASFLITAGVACYLIYHMTKFIRVMNRPA